MMPTPIDDLSLLRAEIAAVAARMIAQAGADYASAKRKAALQVLGERVDTANLLPDNAQIEDAVRDYQTLFQADTQPARLLALRQAALQVMDALAEFSPYLTGAVLNGTAGEYDDIELQLFADSAKEVQIYLLNRNVTIDISETPHFKGARYDPVETVSFLWHGEGVHAELYEKHDLRGALKPRADGRPQRADAATLRSMMTPPTSPQDPT
ncbi:hypothetical protein [Massilia antarctica]|uniref:hypothetical protein n=1 Tax=Massilia antarctica TaxID=2765360 RepID=UPI0006BB92B6|nr:hypothetical protein [Massilia sp. H27-R4]MCY0913554.1 hypothetical protein [Massilia sp. H27-R4]CUI09703.1 Predicted nucleotidyltransferase [Janthinobacterium sp. CG23_2]CUU33489.1 Predicted nucleotidyltransferase [Janthinobacterium sp. CG23_2]